MISKINILEFSESLKNNTQYGNPKIKGTPFAIFSVFSESNKIFFGTYSETKFVITKNASFYPTPFIVSGEIKSKNKTQTEIFYEIKPIGFGYYWLKYMPLIGIFIFNIIFYIESAPFEIFMIMNLALIGFNVFSYFYLREKKNKLVTDFKKVFEIKDNIKS